MTITTKKKPSTVKVVSQTLNKKRECQMRIEKFGIPLGQSQTDMHELLQMQFTSNEERR